MLPPLYGLRVLDLSRILAGPWATQMLEDLGAEIIKIEKPGEGDDTRGWGPPFAKNADGSEGDAAYFHAANRGKKSVCVDLSKPEGANIIKKLASVSDIVVENYKVGGLAKYGLNYGSLAALNPRLIYCSITGFGQTGPNAHRAGYDFMIQGEAGVMSLTGEPEGEPMKMGVAFSDIFAGLHAVIAIQAALIERTQTGKGRHIDIALFDSQVAVLANQAMNYLVGGEVPKRLGNEHPNIVPYQTFETRDGHIIIAAGNDRQFAEFCRIIGADGLGADPRFRTNRGRVELRGELIPALRPYLKARSTAEWVAALEHAAVPCGPINPLDRVFAHEQVKARGLLQHLAQADGSTIPSVANPLGFTSIAGQQPSPKLGQHTHDVLRHILKLGDTELHALRSGGIIA